MGRLAECPFCKGFHRTKRAFNRCKGQHVKLKWTKDGIRK